MVFDDDDPQEDDLDPFDDWSESIALGLIQHDGDVYYDPRGAGHFVQLRRCKGDKLVFGEPCEYYEDAQTCIITQIRSADYLESLVKIEDIGKFDKAEYDGIGWVIQGAFKDLDDLVQRVAPRRRRRNR